jgi:hypothetical protein
MFDVVDVASQPGSSVLAETAVLAEVLASLVTLDFADDDHGRIEQIAWLERISNAAHGTLAAISVEFADSQAVERRGSGYRNADNSAAPPSSCAWPAVCRPIRPPPTWRLRGPGATGSPASVPSCEPASPVHGLPGSWSRRPANSTTCRPGWSMTGLLPPCHR